MLLGVNLISNEGDYGGFYLSSYANNYLREPISRINGVASAQVLGSQTYSMRIWLNPERMTALDITVSDVKSALQEQNVNLLIPSRSKGDSVVQKNLAI